MSSSKVKLVELEACASFLKIALVNPADNKKLFSNKTLLADRIILKIEALFPQKCQECKEQYCSTLNMAQEDTLFECFLCTQLSHNCATLKNIHAALKELTLPKGMVWFCEGCHSKNNLCRTTEENPQEFLP